MGNTKIRPRSSWGSSRWRGFSENKPDTINKLLKHFDYFTQLRTLYKAPLRLHILGHIKVRGIRFSSYYDREDVSAIIDRYVPKGIKVIAPEGEVPK